MLIGLHRWRCFNERCNLCCVFMQIDTKSLQRHAAWANLGCGQPKEYMFGCHDVLIARGCLLAGNRKNIYRAIREPRESKLNQGPQRPKIHRSAPHCLTNMDSHGGDVGRISSYSELSTASRYRAGTINRSSFISSRKNSLRNLVMNSPSRRWPTRKRSCFK